MQGTFDIDLDISYYRVMPVEYENQILVKDDVLDFLQLNFYVPITNYKIQVRFDAFYSSRVVSL